MDRKLLEGLVVIDASTVIAGPISATLLGDYGARVIKVEQPGTGDPARALGTADPSLSAWWQFLGRNKESVTCNLATSAGRGLFRRLVEAADILIENSRPGRMARWGLEFTDLQKVNERLIMLRISGFGQTGPYSDQPGYGTLAEAIGGYAYVTGSPDGPPVLPGVPTADTMAGFAGVSAVLMALHRRSIDGRGCEIDLSLYGPMLYAFGMYSAEASMVGASQERRGTNLPAVAGVQKGDTLRGSVGTADQKWVAYSILSPRLVELVHDFVRPGIVRDTTQPINKAPLNAELRAWIGARPRDVVLAELTAAGIPIAPVYSALDMFEDSHFVERGEFASVPLENGRTATMPIAPFRFDGRGGQQPAPAPALGSSNADVYGEVLGLSESEIARLQADGVL